MKGLTTAWRTAWLGPAVAAAAVFALVWGMSAATAQSASYSATLSGDNVVPPVTTTGSGSFTATYDGATISYTLNASAPEILQAHIHLGAPGENGGVAAFLFGPVDPGQDSVSVSGTIGAADVTMGDLASLVDAMNNNGAYVNVHTTANPAGEIRGPIVASAALPTTGSGGLADEGGSPIWLWALLAGGLTFGAGVAVRRIAAR